VTATKSKKKINSRTKGKTGELDFVHFLKDRGIDARRGQQYEGSSDSPDVVTTGGCLRDTHIEIKRTEVTAIYKWLDQANTDADICKTPVVAHRKNGERWVIIMDARDFISMMQDLDRKTPDHAAILKAVTP
jgi:Holliday junction resolvase